MRGSDFIIIMGRMMIALVAALICALPLRAAAHDILNDVQVQAFVKPDGRRLQLLMRVPLLAMREVDFPRRGIGILDLARADDALSNAAKLWIADNVELYEGDVRLGYPRVVEVRASLPSDKSFASYEEALAHVTGPRLPDNTELYWNQGLLDVLFEYPIRSDSSEFSIHPRLERLGLRTVTALRFLPPGARARRVPRRPGADSARSEMAPCCAQVRRVGFLHILDGTDHLLFLFCLVLPFRRLRSLIPVVTAFTVAHSITLTASAYNLGPDALWFPPLIETLIAISIIYMALGTSSEPICSGGG